MISFIFLISTGSHFPELLCSVVRAAWFCFWFCELFNHPFISLANFWTKIKLLCFAFLPLFTSASVSTQINLLFFLKQHSSCLWISLITASLCKNFLAMKNYLYFRTTPWRGFEREMDLEGNLLRREVDTSIKRGCNIL